jgi:hypothetical protein
MLLLTDGPDCNERTTCDFIKVSDGKRLDAVHDKTSVEGAHWISLDKEHVDALGVVDTSESDVMSVAQLQDCVASKQNEGAPDAPNEVCRISFGCSRDAAVHFSESDSDTRDASASAAASRAILSEYSKIYNHPAFDARHHQWKVFENDLAGDSTERSEELATEADSRSTVMYPGCEDEEFDYLLDHTDGGIVVKHQANIGLFQANSFEVTVGNAEPNGLTGQVGSCESENSVEEMRVDIDVERMMNSQETGDGTTSFHSRQTNVGAVDEETLMYSTNLSERSVPAVDSGFQQYPPLTSSTDSFEISINVAAAKANGTLLAALNDTSLGQESSRICEQLECKIASDENALTFAAINVACHKPDEKHSLLMADDGISLLSHASIPLHRTDSIEDLLRNDQGAAGFTGAHKSAETMNFVAAVDETPQLSYKEKSNEAGSSPAVTSGAAVVFSSDQLLNTLTASSAVSLDTGFSRCKTFRDDARFNVGVQAHSFELNQNLNTHDASSVSGTSACSVLTDYSFENLQDLVSEAECFRRVPDCSSSGSEAEVSPTYLQECDRLVDSERAFSNEDWTSTAEFMSGLVPNQRAWSDYVFRPTGLNPIDESVEWLAEHDTSGATDRAMDLPTDYEMSETDRSAPQTASLGAGVTDIEDMVKGTAELTGAGVDRSSLIDEASELSTATSHDIITANVSHVVQKMQRIRSVESAAVSRAEKVEERESGANSIRLDDYMTSEDVWVSLTGPNADDNVTGRRTDELKVAEMYEAELGGSLNCQPEADFRSEPIQALATNGEVANEPAEASVGNAMKVNTEPAVADNVLISHLTVTSNSDGSLNKAAKLDLVNNTSSTVQNAYEAVKHCGRAERAEAKYDAEPSESSEIDLHSKPCESEVLTGDLVQEEMTAAVKRVDEFCARNSVAKPVEAAFANAIDVCHRRKSTEPELWNRKLGEMNLQSEVTVVPNAINKTECTSAPLCVEYDAAVDHGAETECSKDLTGFMSEASETHELCMHDETLAVDEDTEREFEISKIYALSGLRGLDKESSELSENNASEARESVELVSAELNEMSESFDSGANEISEALELTQYVDQEMTDASQCDEEPVTSMISMQYREVLEVNELSLVAERELAENVEITGEGEVSEIMDLRKQSDAEIYQLDQPTNLDLEETELGEQNPTDHMELLETPNLPEAECVPSESEEQSESDIAASQYVTADETVAVFANANAADATGTRGPAVADPDLTLSAVQPSQSTKAEARGTLLLLRQDDKAMVKSASEMIGIARVPEEAERCSTFEEHNQQASDVMTDDDEDQRAGVFLGCKPEPRSHATASGKGQAYQQSARFESDSNPRLFSHVPALAVSSKEDEYRERMEPTCEADLTLTYDFDENSLETSSVHLLQTAQVEIDADMKSEIDVITASEFQSCVDAALLHQDVDAPCTRFECQVGSLPASGVKDLEEHSSSTVGFENSPLAYDSFLYQETSTDDQMEAEVAATGIQRNEAADLNDAEHFNPKLIEWIDHVTLLTPLAFERAEEIVEQAELTEFFDALDLDEGDATVTGSEVQLDTGLNGGSLSDWKATKETKPYSLFGTIPSFYDANGSTGEHRPSFGASDIEANEDLLTPSNSSSSEVILGSHFSGKDLAVDNMSDVDVSSPDLPRSTVGLDGRKPSGSDASFACSASTSEVRDIPADSTPTDLLCNLEKIHSTVVKMEDENSEAYASSTDVVTVRNSASDQLGDAALESTCGIAEEQFRGDEVLAGGSRDSASALDDATVHR